MHEVISPTACVGCLDAGECWVCLGEGRTVVRRRVRGERDEQVTCWVCHGTGICTYCTPDVMRLTPAQVRVHAVR